MVKVSSGGKYAVLEQTSPYTFASSRFFLDKYFPNYQNLHGTKLQDSLFRSSILLYALYVCFESEVLATSNFKVVFDSVVKSISEDDLLLVHTVADSRRNSFSELVEKNELFRDIFVCRKKGYSVSKSVNSMSEYALTDYGKVVAGEIKRLDDYFCYDLLKVESYMSVQSSIFFNDRMYFSIDNPYYKADLSSQIYKSNEGLNYSVIRKHVSENAESVRFINPEKLPSIDASYSDYDMMHKSKEYVFSSYEKNADCMTNLKIDTEMLAECLSRNYPDHIVKILQGIKNGIDENGWLKVYYKKNFHGRYYCKGRSVQQLPAELRRILFSDYVEIDMKCAIYTVLYNLALKFAITDIPCIAELAIHSDEKRSELYEKYRKIDPNLTEEYIKIFLTSLSYGANVAPDYIVNAMKNSKIKCVPLDIDGYEDRFFPLALAEDEFIINLVKEIRRVVKMLSKVFTEKRDGRKYLINLYGDAMLLDRQATLGKRLAHMYQSIESTVLMKVLEYKDIRENAGLLLHDGLYIRRDCISKININDISKFIYNELGYQVIYELKE